MPCSYEPQFPQVKSASICVSWDEEEMGVAMSPSSETGRRKEEKGMELSLHKVQQTLAWCHHADVRTYLTPAHPDPPQGGSTWPMFSWPLSPP